MQRRPHRRPSNHRPVIASLRFSTPHAIGEFTKQKETEDAEGRHLIFHGTAWPSVTATLSGEMIYKRGPAPAGAAAALAPPLPERRFFTLASPTRAVTAGVGARPRLRAGGATFPNST